LIACWRIQVKRSAKGLRMRTIRLGLFLAASALALAVTPTRAQDVICCMDIINVGGDWFGAIRLENCQKYFDEAATPVLRKLCRERRSLACINTSRCNGLPPEDTAAKNPPSGGTAALPPNPDRDGLGDGFGGLPPAPPTGGISPPRLVYLIMGAPSGGKPLIAFTVFLDRAACLVPLANNNQPSDPAAAKHVVRGRIARSDGRVRIEAEASELAGGAKLGSFTGEAEGEDAAAVAKATRAVTEKMKLVCAR
jgi:hypothetical protein